MKITRLAEDGYWEKYSPLCRAIAGLSNEQEEAIRLALEDLTKRLVAALARWELDEDYGLMDDWNPCWHHSGGIMEKAAFCPEFVEAIHGVLSKEEKPWCFHLACAPEFEGIGDGSIFFFGGKVFALDDGEFDYSILES